MACMFVNNSVYIITLLICSVKLEYILPYTYYLSTQYSYNLYVYHELTKCMFQCSIN